MLTVFFPKEIPEGGSITLEDGSTLTHTVAATLEPQPDPDPQPDPQPDPVIDPTGHVRIGVGGQSNGSGLYSSNALQNALTAAGLTNTVFNTAAGGSMIARQGAGWSVTRGDGEDGVGTLYTNMIDLIGQNVPDGEQLTAICWVHGESDAFTPGTYEQDLTDLILKAREDLGYEVPFIVSGPYRDGDLYQSGVVSGYLTILQAMQNIAATLPNVHYIDTGANVLKIGEADQITHDVAMADQYHYKPVVFESYANYLLTDGPLSGLVANA